MIDLLQAQRRGGASARRGRCVCPRYLRNEEEAVGAVNLSSTCSSAPATWCEVSHAGYPVARIYYTHPSLFWQLIVRGNEKEQPFYSNLREATQQS